MKRKDLHPRVLSPAKLSFRMEGQIKCFPEKVRLKEFIIPYYMKCCRDLSKKKNIKTMNSKMTTNSQLSTTEPKKIQKQKNQANNYNRNRITEMEITWRDISG